MALNNKFAVKVDEADYQIKIALFANDEIEIELESVTSKYKYSAKKDAKDVLTITSLAKMELDTKQFYDLVQKAFEASNQNITYSILPDGDNFKLTINWRLNEIIVREFELQLENANIPDADRMSKIMSDFMVEKDKMKADVISLAENKNEIVEKLNNFDAKMLTMMGQIRTIQTAMSNVVNVAVYKDSVMRNYDPLQPVIDIKYNKRHPNSKLYIHTTISVCGGNSVYNLQFWNYGKNKKINAQYDHNNKYGVRNITSICVIENHRQTGNQALQITMRGERDHPLSIINPNINDYPTGSIIRVEEIIE